MLRIFLYKLYFYIVSFPITFLFNCFKGGGVYKIEYYYHGEEKVSLNYLNSQNFFLRNLLIPLFVIDGKVNLIGDYLSFEKYNESDSTKGKPGIFSLYELRELVKFPRNSIGEANKESHESKSFFYDLCFLIRYTFSYLLFTSSAREEASYVEISGIKALNITCHELLVLLKEKGRKIFYFVNAESINQSFKNKNYSKILKKNAHNLIDGSGVALACKLTNQSVAENLNGTDLFFPILQHAIEAKKSIYFLGASEQTIDAMLKLIRLKYPSLRIAGARNGFFIRDDNNKIISEINDSRADILMVGMGTPLQESWIDVHKEQLAPSTILAVGGLFDFVSEKKKRAPLFMREMGMEWCYRLFLEPRRLFCRYVLGNVIFLLRVLYHRNM